MIQFSFTTFIQRDDDELEVAVTYSASPYVPATYWQPAEGHEVELITTDFVGACASTLPTHLNDIEEAHIIAECEGRVASDFGDRADDEADFRYEQQRDRRMENWA